jgi:RHS repeat-associated protein
VTALVEPDGDVAERVVYDPYGQPTFLDPNWQNPSVSSAVDNEPLFTGHRRDPETGLTYGLMRYYHPALGRWLSRDATGYRDGMNLCQYCRSKPLLLLDTMGAAVSGTLTENAETVYDSTSKYRKEVGSGPAGVTRQGGDVRVTGTYSPRLPCCCTFTVTAFDFWIHSHIAGIGVWYERYTGKMSASLFAVVRMHEGFHREENVSVWRDYIGQLTAARTCCYTRGLWVFQRGYPQSQELCNERAKWLGDYLLDQLSEYLDDLHAVSDAYTPYSQRAAEQLHTDAMNHIEAMQMRDWGCVHTIGLWRLK